MRSTGQQLTTIEPSHASTAEGFGMQRSPNWARAPGRLLLGVLFMTGMALPVMGQSPQRPGVDNAEDLAAFEKMIRPLFAAHCYSCHSAKAAKLRGELRLDTREGIL